MWDLKITQDLQRLKKHWLRAQSPGLNPGSLSAGCATSILLPFFSGINIVSDKVEKFDALDSCRIFSSTVYVGVCVCSVPGNTGGRAHHFQNHLTHAYYLDDPLFGIMPSSLQLTEKIIRNYDLEPEGSSAGKPKGQTLKYSASWGFIEGGNGGDTFSSTNNLACF